VHFVCLGGGVFSKMLHPMVILSFLMPCWCHSNACFHCLGGRPWNMVVCVIVLGF
jgi:hypothetical protein